MNKQIFMISSSYRSGMRPEVSLYNRDSLKAAMEAALMIGRNHHTMTFDHFAALETYHYDKSLRPVRTSKATFAAAIVRILKAKRKATNDDESSVAWCEVVFASAEHSVRLTVTSIYLS